MSSVLPWCVFQFTSAAAYMFFGYLAFALEQEDTDYGRKGLLCCMALTFAVAVVADVLSHTL